MTRKSKAKVKQTTPSKPNQTKSTKPSQTRPPWVDIARAPDLSIKTKLRGLVVTSDIKGAGTDAKVQIWITDSQGKTAGPITMQEKGGDAMERGQRNPLEVNLIDCLRDIYKIAISHDGSKTNPDWHLERIELSLVDLKTGEVRSKEPTPFHFNKWIRPNAIYEAGAPHAVLVTYIIHVKTADERGRKSQLILSNNLSNN